MVLNETLNQTLNGSVNKTINETLNNTIAGQTTVFLGDVAPIYDKIFSAIIILLVGIVIGRIVGILLDKLFVELQINKAASMFSRRTYSLAKALSDIFSFLTYLGALFLALDKIGALFLVLNILLGLIILIALGALILEAIDFFPNLFAGIMLKSKGINKGIDFKFMNLKGKIEHKGLLSIMIISENKDEYHIPNRAVLSSLKSKFKLT